MDREFNEKVDQISLRNWMSVFELIPEIENTKVFGKYVSIPNGPNGEVYFGGYSWADILETFHKRVYKNELIISFDWMNWEKGIYILEHQAHRTDYTIYDFYTLAKLLVAIVRNEKFCDGYLVKAAEEGTILKVLIALQKAVNERHLNGHL